MSDDPSASRDDRATDPGPRRAVRAVAVALALVVAPPLLLAVALVGAYAAGEWGVLRAHDAIRPHDRRLGRAMWGRLEPAGRRAGGGTPRGGSHGRGPHGRGATATATATRGAGSPSARA